MRGSGSRLAERLATAVEQVVDGIRDDLREELLTDQEAAKILKISTCTLQKSEVRGRIIAMGARVIRIEGDGSGQRSIWRWSRLSLLALPRTVDSRAVCPGAQR